MQLIHQIQNNSNLIEIIDWLEWEMKIPKCLYYVGAILCSFNASANTLNSPQEMQSAYTNDEIILQRVADALEKGEYSRAFTTLKPLADRGNTFAQFGIAGMYETGAGIPQNDTKAMEYYLKSANGGFSVAQFTVGRSLALNNGDFTSAAKWYKKAAEQDFAEAQLQLGSLYLLGWGVEKDEQQAFKWYKAAAIQNLPQAQYQVGVAYVMGSGVRSDAKQAIYWLNKACVNNVQNACKAIDLMSQGAK